MSGTTPDGNNRCATEFIYICTNGIPQDGTTDTPNTERCGSCNAGYVITSANRCALRITGNLLD